MSVPGDKVIDQGHAHPVKLLAPNAVFEPAQRRLRCKVRAGQRQSVRRQLEHRIGAERIEVIAVLVAKADAQHPLTQHVRDPLAHLAGLATIRQALRESLHQAEPSLDLPQQDQATIRGNRSAVKAGYNLTRTKRKR